MWYTGLHGARDLQEDVSETSIGKPTTSEVNTDNLLLFDDGISAGMESL